MNPYRTNAAPPDPRRRARRYRRLVNRSFRAGVRIAILGFVAAQGMWLLLHIMAYVLSQPIVGSMLPPLLEALAGAITCLFRPR